MDVCGCACHVGGVRRHHIPPDVRDVIAAATACSKCLNQHCPALLNGITAPRYPAPVSMADGYLYDPTEDTE